VYNETVTLTPHPWNQGRCSELRMWSYLGKK
jgi:hypothetical protein